MKIYAERQRFSGQIDIHLARQVGDDLQTAKPLEFETTHAGRYTEPFVKLNQDSAQLLMDELWNCGLRPSEGSGSAGSLAATQRHLDDMRRLVFADAPAHLSPFGGKP